MKKLLFTLFILTASCLMLFTACQTECEVCSFGDWETVTEATCTAEGEKVRICSECQKEDRQPIEKKAHDLSLKETTLAATCTAEGKEKISCKNCDYSEEKSISKISHTYTSKVTTEATCAKTGTNTATCTKCGHSYTSSIPKTSTHSTNFGKCSVCKQTITTLKSTATEIAGYGSDGTEYMNECLTNIKSALKSSTYKGTSSAIFNLAQASGMYSKAAEACGNHPEFKTIKSLLNKIHNKLSNTFSGTVSVYSDYRDYETIKKMVNTMNEISPYMEQVMEIVQEWKNY